MIRPLFYYFVGLGRMVLEILDGPVKCGTFATSLVTKSLQPLAERRKPLIL